MKVSLLIGLTFGVFATTPGVAHHAAAALYLLDQELIIEGIVTEYQFINPHARVYLDVVNADGEVEQWLAEGGSPNVLRRHGWDGQELKQGDRITITGNPPRDGSKLVHWVTITLPDGSELFGEDVDYGAVDRLRRQQRD